VFTGSNIIHLKIGFDKCVHFHLHNTIQILFGRSRKQNDYKRTDISTVATVCCLTKFTRRIEAGESLAQARRGLSVCPRNWEWSGHTPSVEGPEWSARLGLAENGQSTPWSISLPARRRALAASLIPASPAPLLPAAAVTACCTGCWHSWTPGANVHRSLWCCQLMVAPVLVLRDGFTATVQRNYGSKIDAGDRSNWRQLLLLSASSHVDDCQLMGELNRCIYV